MIPAGHRAFVADTLARFGVPELNGDAPVSHHLLGWTDATARPQVEVALAHPIALLANALGPPPADIVRQAHERGVKVAALASTARHARKQVEVGVDIVVAQGTEAGGHTGEISTMVLVPEVVDAVGPVPVLAAGGIGRGRQMAAALALGAEGVWTGSLWLTVAEADSSPVVREKLLAATSRDTVRSRSMTGKPARMLAHPVDRGVGGRRCAEHAADAAAVHAHRRGVPADPAVRRPGAGGHAGRPDRRRDERDPVRARRDVRPDLRST